MEIKHFMKKMNGVLAAGIIVVAILIAAGTAITALNYSDRRDLSSPTDLSPEELIKRGAYLVNTSGCHDCHSPKIMTPRGPEPDPERLLSGHPSSLPLPKVNKEALKDWVLFNQLLTGIAGPWGVSFGANLTSDETGIGNWSEEQFFRAIREGKYKGLEGTRFLLPPMPWQVYRNMTDMDLRSIFAYLKSTNPVHNVVPSPIPPDRISDN